MKRNVFVVGVAVSACCTHGDTMVIPQDRESQSGTLAYNAGFTGSGSSQTVYGARNFAGPVEITGVAFRADEGSDQFRPSFDVVIPNFTVRLTTYMGTVSTFSSVYASNAAADDTMVFAGSVHWTGVNAAGDAPNPFDMSINFTTPFIYDPSKGQLLMHYDSAGPMSPSLVAAADYHGHGDLTIGFTYMAGINSGNLVTQFTFQSIPEPKPIAYLALATICFALCYRRRA